jgi:hypothetical protein
MLLLTLISRYLPATPAWVLPKDDSSQAHSSNLRKSVLSVIPNEARNLSEFKPRKKRDPSVRLVSRNDRILDLTCELLGLVGEFHY